MLKIRHDSVTHNGENNDMAALKFSLYEGNSSNRGCPIKLVVRKNNERKIISLDIYAHPHQWDEDLQRYKMGRSKDLHPDRTKNNEYLNRKEIEASDIVAEFDRLKINWTLNQFEDMFLHKGAMANVNEFFTKLVSDLKATNHIGNAKCYDRTLNMLKIFDPQFNKRKFSEIGIKYVNAFDIFLQKPRVTNYSRGDREIIRKGCSGNTRKYYHKALRAAYNKAMEQGDADTRFYPYGKGRFEVSKLTEITAKRYLSDKNIETIKTIPCKSINLEIARNLFLLSYYCHGISYVDMAQLSTESMFEVDNHSYIVYKRQKTKHNKSAKLMYVKIIPEIVGILEWFKNNTILIGDYITPCITRDHSSEERLYEHISNRRGRYNDALKEVAKELKIDVNLTTYVARHSVAMKLRNNNVSIDKIAQVFGHNDIKTTNVYLDSFENRVIDEVVGVL